MGLQDREYMRRRTREPARRTANSRPWFLIAGSVLAVAAITTWLFRDFRPAFQDATTRQGSLVVNVNTAT
jgi:hypothetical protein